MNLEEIKFFLYTYKKILLTILWVFIFLIVLSFLLKDSDKNDLIITDISPKIITEQKDQNYYNTTKTTTTPLPDNFEEKLKQENKLEQISLSFDNNWFKEDKDYRFNLQTNIKLDIDASSTNFPDWTVLTLSIPWTDLNQSIITVPWRYRYSIYFKEMWKKKFLFLESD